MLESLPTIRDTTRLFASGAIRAGGRGAAESDHRTAASNLAEISSARRAPRRLPLRRMRSPRSKWRYFSAVQSR